jgi:hypothetical protein
VPNRNFIQEKFDMDMYTPTQEDIDLMLHFIDLLELGRAEDITAKKPLPVS